MILVKINAEKDTAASNAFHVSGFPTAVMIDKDGNEIDRVVGYAEPEQYLETLRDYAKGIGTLGDLLNKFKENPNREMAYEIADKYKYRGGMDDAKTWYQKVIEMGEPKDSLSGESRIALADMIRRAKEYDKALAAFEKVMEDFNGTSFGELAEIYRAIVYRQKGDTAAALSAFEQFVKNHPESEDVGYAQKQIKKLKGENGNKKK